MSNFAKLTRESVLAFTCFSPPEKRLMARDQCVCLGLAWIFAGRIVYGLLT